MYGPDFWQTVCIMQHLHGQQVDKAGYPYWQHPFRVAGIYIGENDDATQEGAIAALLHDVVEDAPITINELRQAGWSETVVTVVELLTRDKKAFPDYLDWIKAIIGSGNRLAMQIKLADISDNLDPRRELPEACKSLRKRYTRAAVLLSDALDVKGNRT